MKLMSADDGAVVVVAAVCTFDHQQGQRLRRGIGCSLYWPCYWTGADFDTRRLCAAYEDGATRTRWFGAADGVARRPRISMTGILQTMTAQPTCVSRVTTETGDAARAKITGVAVAADVVGAVGVVSVSLYRVSR